MLRPEEVQLPKKVTTQKILSGAKWICNIFVYQCAAVIFIYSIWIPLVAAYSWPFSWHVVLSTFGMIPFMFESVILFSNSNISWYQTLTRKEKYWIHGILMSVGTLLFVVGIGLETWRRCEAVATYPDIGHFVSVHSVTGLISMILIILAYPVGYTAFNSTKLKSYGRPVLFKLFHNVLGQVGYIIGFISLICGFYTSWFEYYTTEVSRTAATIAGLVVLIWSIKSSFVSMFYQIKSIAT